MKHYGNKNLRIQFCFCIKMLHVLLPFTPRELLLRLRVFSFQFLVIAVNNTEIIHNHKEKVKHHNSKNILKRSNN